MCFLLASCRHRHGLVVHVWRLQAISCRRSPGAFKGSPIGVLSAQVSKILQVQQWDKLHCQGAPAPTNSSTEGHQIGTSMPSGIQVKLPLSTSPFLLLCSTIFNSLHVCCSAQTYQSQNVYRTTMHYDLGFCILHVSNIHTKTCSAHLHADCDGCIRSKL